MPETTKQGSGGFTVPDRLAGAVFLLSAGAVLGAWAVCHVNERAGAGKEGPTARAEVPPPDPCGRWEDEPVPVTLADYVEFVFQTPEGCPAAREFGLLVEPLLARSREARPPDFIRVRRERFGRAARALPPDADAARDVLIAVLARSPSVPPRPPVPAGEWEETAGLPLWRVPGELTFLRGLPTRRATHRLPGPADAGRTFEGVSPVGQGNAAALERALEFARGERKGVRELGVPPPGPGP
jgi:hypothetical protein